MRLLSIAILALPLSSSTAWAHRLLSETKITAKELVVEAYFEDDTPAQEAKVTVWKGDQRVAEGKTDEKGVWKMPRPEPGSYRIRVENLGHLSKETIEITDTTTTTDTPEESSEPTHAKPQTPWFAVGTGLLIIAGLAFLARFLRKGTPPTNPTP